MPQSYYQGGGGIGGGFTPVVKRLLIANVAVFLLSIPLRNIIWPTFALVPALAVKKLYLWQFFTYMYLHGGVFHLVFNMFSLWMFGSMVESVWGGRRFFLYYTICGIGGGICTWLLSPNYAGITLGASGAIFGLLLAYGLLFPESYIFLWFLIPIKAKHFVFLFAALELFAGLNYTPDGVAHFAHLGGMLFGFVYMRLGFPGWRSKARLRMPRAPIRIVRSTIAPRTRQEQVDEILDKITSKGIDSLTPDEKRLLEETDEEES
jgi:membrane associated rhomboid family serine protease